MLPPADTVGAPNGFRDRKAGLVVFGILTALMGCLCALLVPVMFFGQAMAATKGAGMGVHTMLPAAVMYGVIATIFIWLGIGSIMARRWARALLLILAWSWLIIGT